jgi:magnesium-protoporphyrin O-methyltransferase
MPVMLPRDYDGRVDCCDRTIYDDQFDAGAAARQVRDYRRRGPTGWTARLIADLGEGGVDGATVLDIGAGVGAVHLALLGDGAASATDVDASGPYLAVARAEAERLGLADRVAYHKGDAVRVAADLPEADLVALDRVVCCYPDMRALVGVASERARRRLGMVVPRDRRLVRGAVALANGWNALTRNPFRIYVHATGDVLAVATAAGLELRHEHRGVFWQTLVLERPAV